MIKLFDRDGTTLINEAIEGFSTIISKLKQGVVLNLNKISENEEEIATLTNHNITMVSSNTRADRIIEKLEELIS